MNQYTLIMDKSAFDEMLQIIIDVVYIPDCYISREPVDHDKLFDALTALETADCIEDIPST